MAAITSTIITRDGVAVAAAAAPATTLTISSADVSRGVMLELLNGGGSAITATITDPGRTPLGNSGTFAANSIAAGAGELMWLTPDMLDSTGVVTVTLSTTTSVTYRLFRPSTY